MTIAVLFLDGKLMGVYDSTVTANKVVERYRDACDHPPNLDQFLILEKPVLTD